ncbi:Mediator of RNA polymerase II transcription subunit 23 [Frankliniella fusca]|uniref:Mediator of RNA polymerase II transcription subunit 23 n=1 Tax=Frankliniella fusca TaxID=407009 RepID=A0AAE1HNQ7_9NEOP|nr:Mediator of RNA polymerase II transcription subunit 23 [Frankliniella fusca]
MEEAQPQRTVKMTEMQVANILNDFMRTEAVEEGLSCFLMQRPETDRMSTLKAELCTILSGLAPQQQEAGVKQYLNIASLMTNSTRLQLLLKVLHDLVQKNVLQAQMVCECILMSEKLTYKNSVFWIECFNLIKKIIGGVYYKGVRDIMKICREKVQTLPVRLTASVMPQMKAVESVLEHLFDRSACLLPAYLLINEVMKDGKICPHWKLAPLLSNFIESFRPTAQMVSIIGRGKMLPIVLGTGISDQYALPWRLDANTLKLPLKGTLPYDPQLLEPQTALLLHVLDQPYSRDMVCAMLGLQRQKTHSHCKPLENQIVDLIVVAMERAENESHAEENIHSTWLHLSSLLIFFVLGHYANFNNLCQSLHQRLSVRTDLRKGRDHVMFVCLQFVTGAISKNPLSEFLSLLKLYDLLYPEKEPLPVLDINNPMCTHQMAACSIWIHFNMKAKTENLSLHRPIPIALKAHHEFIQHLKANYQPSLNNGCDFPIAILCNAYSTNNEHLSRPMSALVETIKLPSQPNHSNPPLQLPFVPLSMAMLDAMTVHCKMTIIHNIVTHIVKAAQSKSHSPLPPALVETYSRLLVYTEIESLGVKGFINQVLPTVFKSHAWGILYTLLEMFSYRMHHILPHYRVQLLSHLHSLASVPQTNQTQLHLCMESTALRLITGLASSEVQPELSRFPNEPKMLVSAESEELNRALVLTLARSMHITGSGQEQRDKSQVPWCKELLNTIMQYTPHTWANHTLEYFPPVLRDFFHQNRVPMENQHQLKKAVEEEYRNWSNMSNDNDIINHFSEPGTPPLFLCLLWKVILETERVNPIAYTILERIGPRALSTHLRKFCVYLVNEFSASSSSGQQQHHVNKCVDAVNLMIWQYNIITIDRLILCLSMRPHEGQMCFFIIQVLLLKSTEFRTRVQKFVNENSPDHWKQSNWYEKHMAFHNKYPENFGHEGTGLEQSGSNTNSYPLPVYFGNVCLRFLPVFDNLIHRYLEMPTSEVNKSLESLLEHLGMLYKFHDRPVTYLYNTLHYYESKVRDRASLKRRLVYAVLTHLQDSKVHGFGLSVPYQQYMQGSSDIWNPDLDYYKRLIERICDTMSGKIQLHTDWRFNEFPNAASHVVYVTCVELMALPMPPVAVGNSLLDVVTKGYTVIPPQQIMSWINAIGLVMAALPNSYWQALHERLVQVINCPQMLQWPYRNSPFQMFNFQDTHDSMLENKFSYALALAHSIWHHAGSGQIYLLPRFVKEHLYPIIRTEEQLLFLCHLIGPFFQRIHAETHPLTELTVALYETIEQVDQNVPFLHHMDTISDLLYHIKYMFVGDVIKAELMAIIKRLRPSLQMRLRFLVHLSLDEIKGC